MSTGEGHLTPALVQHLLRGPAERAEAAVELLSLMARDCPACSEAWKKCAEAWESCWRERPPEPVRPDEEAPSPAPSVERILQEEDLPRRRAKLGVLEPSADLAEQLLQSARRSLGERPGEARELAELAVRTLWRLQANGRARGRFGRLLVRAWQCHGDARRQLGALDLAELSLQRALAARGEQRNPLAAGEQALAHALLARDLGEAEAADTALNDALEAFQQAMQPGRLAFARWCRRLLWAEVRGQTQLPVRDETDRGTAAELEAFLEAGDYEAAWRRLEALRPWFELEGNADGQAVS